MRRDCHSPPAHNSTLGLRNDMVGGSIEVIKYVINEERSDAAISSPIHERPACDEIATARQHTIPRLGFAMTWWL
jgi:hypothetical protein